MPSTRSRNEALFRQEVSDAIRGAKNALRQLGWPMALDRFIIPTPDPISLACRELGIDRGELARRGVKLVECE